MKGIPEQIQTWLDGREWEENHIGMSGSRVLTAEDRVLKIQRVSPRRTMNTGSAGGWHIKYRYRKSWHMKLWGTKPAV